MSSGMKRVRAYVTGRVQGVSFRQSTRKAAATIGVTGWVRNLPDGRVEVLIEGYPFQVDELLKFIHRGPRFAIVEEVLVTEEIYQGEFTEFKVQRGNAAD